MMKKLLVISLLLLAASLFSSVGWLQENPGRYSGLLLGLRNDSNEHSTYRTLWLTATDGIVNISEGEGIFVAYGDVFWHIERNTYKQQVKSEYGPKDIQIEYLLSHPVETRVSNQSAVSAYSKGLFEHWMSAAESSKLVFVGNRYVCIHKDYGYESGGTMRPWKTDSFVKEIKDINRSFQSDMNINITDRDNKSNISLKSFFGENVNAYIAKYRAMQITENEEAFVGREPKTVNLTDEYSWGLIRKDMRWHPQIAKKWYFSNWSTFREKYILYDLPLEIPKSLVAYNEFSYSMDEIKKAVPDAMDAVISPNRNLIIVLTPAKLVIYPENLANKPKMIALKGKESLIMAEWALGKYVEKWTFELHKYLRRLQDNQ
jgi:hypothetical protein